MSVSPTGVLFLLGAFFMAAPASALPFEPGEHLTLSVTYMRMGIGSIDVDVGEDVQNHLWPIEMTARTTGFFNHVHSVNDRFVAGFDPVTLRSQGNVFEQHESHREAVESTRIDGTTAFIHRSTRDGEHDRTMTVPAGSIDVLSAIYFLRTQRIEGMPEVRVPIFTGAKTWELVARADGYQTVKTEAGQFETIVVRCRTWFGGKFSSQKELTVYLSNDERRLPVKIEADFALGTMRAELKSYHQGALARR